MADTNEWQTVTVPTRCFMEQGAQFGEVFSPVALSGTSDAHIIVSNIRFEVDVDNAPTCKD